MDNFMDEMAQRRQRWADGRSLKRTNGRDCIRRLHGKHCRVYRTDGGCECMPFGKLGIDHATLWIRDGRARVFVYHPYGFSEEHRSALLAYCKEYGLWCVVKQPSESFYNPGSTHQIEVWNESPVPWCAATSGLS